MQLRPLGRSELRLPPLVLGTMPRRARSDGEWLDLWRGAIERGFTALDTAPLYGYGAVESLLGRALAGIPRERVQILGKVGLRWDQDARGRVLYTEERAGGAPRVVRCDARPESVRSDVEQSLARLGVDHLDLVQIHQPDFETPLAETMGELLDLRQRGLVRAIGASNASAHELRAMQVALGSTPLASVQAPWSLADRRLERDLLPMARKLGLGVLAYAPLDGGRLARGEGPAGALLAQQALELRAAPAALALAWLLARPELTAAIVGASSLAQLEDLRAALSQPLLPRHEMSLEHFLPAPKLRLRQRVRRAGAAILRSVGLRGRS